MAVSIQETTIVPAADGHGHIVQLYISDKSPADEASASLALTLRLQIDQTRSGTLAAIQLDALNGMLEALKPLLSSLYR